MCVCLANNKTGGGSLSIIAAGSIRVPYHSQLTLTYVQKNTQQFTQFVHKYCIAFTSIQGEDGPFTPRTQTFK